MAKKKWLNFLVLSNSHITPEMRELAKKSHVTLVNGRQVDPWAKNLEKEISAVENLFPEETVFDGIVTDHPRVALVATHMSLKVGLFQPNAFHGQRDSNEYFRFEIVEV